jgi:hypothetical protein
MKKAPKSKKINVNNSIYTFFPGGAVAVEDCGNKFIGNVSAKSLDAVVEAATLYAKAPRIVAIGASEYDIDYGDDGSVAFGVGDRCFSLADLKRIQKLSHAMRGKK